MIDLHIHSEYSDGTFTVEQIIKHASEKNFTALSITDHDTVSGQNEAVELASKYKVNYIPGIEFSVEYNITNGSYHLLGYGIDYNSEKLNRICREIQDRRMERNRKIIRLASMKGFEISFSELSQRFNTKSPGRPHIAAMMKEKGYVKSIYEAFDKYLGDDKILFVKKDDISADEAVKAITESGGIAVIAHPVSLKLNKEAFSQFFRQQTEKGVSGIEAFNSGFKNRKSRKFLRYNDEILKQINPIYTAGSDFHGSNKPGIKMGRDSSGAQISDDFLPDKLKKKIITLD